MASQVAVAAVSPDVARAGRRTAEAGGNAVDVAVATGITAAVTHPGMCSLGGGAFVTLWPPGAEPLVIDGGVETPGRGLAAEERGGGGVEVRLAFGGGLETVAGPGSVAVPGLLAACAVASRRFGRLPWSVLLEPALERAREGFPLPAACHAFLLHAYEPIYARDDRSRSALGDADGGLAEPGATVRPKGLAESLELLAREGVDAFYRGPLGRRIAEHVRERGGSLTRQDLQAYRPELRRPVEVELDGWRVATNPPPAAGGRILAALLALSRRRPDRRWTPTEVGWLVRTQRAVLHYARGEDVDDLPDPARTLLEASAPGRRPPPRGSSSTVHTSAVDDDGRICSITMSDGYGSGVMPPGTGIWLNNCLGERTLNPGGLADGPPGRRLPSNMAPTVARSSSGEALALGSPGSERIPTALHQVLLNRIRLRMSPREAVRHPRLHVEPGDDGLRVASEPGLPTDEVELPVRRYGELDMFFGGVTLVERDRGGGFRAAADPRRDGGTAPGPGG